MAASQVIADQTDRAGGRRQATTGSTWYRLGAASGLVFLVLFIAAIVVSSFPPDSDAGILRYYSDPSVQARSLQHFFFVAFGCFFLLLFVSTMRTALVSSEPGTDAVAQLAFIGGVLTAALFLVTGAVEGGIVAASIKIVGFRLDPNTARAIGGVAYLLFMTASMTAAVWVGPASVIAIRKRIFPIWVCWLGMAAAIAQLLAWFLFGTSPLLGLWIAITSVLMIRRGPQGATESGQPST